MDRVRCLRHVGICFREVFSSPRLVATVSEAGTYMLIKYYARDETCVVHRYNKRDADTRLVRYLPQPRQSRVSPTCGKLSPTVYGDNYFVFIKIISRRKIDRCS